MDVGRKHLVNIPKAVSQLIDQNEAQDQAISDLDDMIRQALAGVFHYKGSVATYGDLPTTDNQVGDVWNVLADGKNYAWSGTAWDDLGGIVDLSNYVTLDSDQTITGVKEFSNGIETSTIKYTNGADKIFLTALDIGLGGTTTPRYGNSYDLGNSSYKWENLYLHGKINKNSSDYGLTLPDTTSFTADSELLDSASDQTITGAKTFSNGLKTSMLKDASGNNKIGLGTNVAIYGSNLISGSNGSYDLGTSSLKWKDVYISGSVITDYIGNYNTVYSRANFNPEQNNQFNLGNGTYKWKNVYIASNIHLGSAIFWSTTGSIRFNTGLSPNEDNNFDIGATSYRYKDLYLGGVITDGTNSVTVADLAALIAYAKAQGWIS